MKLCDTCIYGSKTEYFKPCIIYRDNCEYYEKERSEMTDDLISRQAVLDLCDSTDPEYKVVHFKEDVECLPSVRPQEPKTGHWKRISIDKYSEHAKYWYRCDRCGKDNLGNTDWCPNCGCRMVEPQESEESDADSN